MARAHFGAFAGKSRWEMRAAVVDALVAAGAYAGKRDAEQSVVSRCSRSGDIIEPMLMPQWYLRCGEMAQRANDLVATGLIELLPAQQRASWHRWMSGIEDWCVSRQLWWGHRIPVYRVSWSAGGIRDVWVAAESSDQAKAKALARLSAAERAEIPSADEDAIGAVHQDEDVLDTWFSSALLPLTTFNYSSEHKTALAPPRHADGAGISGGGGGGGGDNSNSSSRALSSVLETGQDILFFWVARMAMLCTHFSQVPPFEKVLLHPMVRDSQGRKMSKSLGNIIDPMDVINGAGLAKLEETLTRGHLSEQELSRSVRELKRLYPQGLQRFGADALRLTLLLYTQQTQQINMSLDSVKASYHFCNKLWNTFRFVHAHAARLGIQTSNADIGTGADTEYSPVWLLGIDSAQLTVFDRALLSKLWGMLQTYHNAMDTCRIAAAAETVREFVQRELCDRYIEVSKLALFGKTNATRQDPSVAAKILLGTLDIVLRALHPFMPFLSLKQQHPACFGAGDAGDEPRISIAVSMRSQQGERDAHSCTAGVARGALEIAERHAECIRLMSREAAIRICTVDDRSSGVGAGEGVGVVVVTADVRVIGQLRASQAAGAAGRTAGAVARLEAELDKARRTAASEGYRQRAPAAVKEADRRRMAMLEAKIAASRR
ncbi:hypothetical protein LPJ61_001404 [Coemansia biformis]|uniref:valine--tRNA ligase n=1 Tax=Coemansia biformis TaxID=1286918 RepID=A0A9W7YHR6_9FUNG|nr:hypothetical protein LPJ61_001404 [Coemansia biformis]